MKYDVIIIGAGAAGLSAMKVLAENGYSICLLEATDKAGGRIATIREEKFSFPVETGAEFIHGKLPYTFKVLKEAGISCEVVEGKMVGVQKGEWQEEEHDEHWDKFMKELNKLKTDITVLQFLDDHFTTPEYTHLRQSVQRFAEGFDLADISKASILALRHEWREIEKTQYRVKGGYIQLIDYLLKCSLQKNALIYFNTPVNKVEKTKDGVVVHTTDNKKFYSGKLIATVSLGVLQSGSIRFEPELTDHAIAIQGLGFGSVIKFLFEFKTAFWKEFDDDIGFLLTDEEIPTWWTQAPAESNLLTGWLGGPRAAEKIFQSEDELLQTAINSLSSIFKMPVAMLREELYYYKIISWQNTQYIKGGYSYSTLASERARKIMSTPVDDMIFFAGEAISDSDSPGTVEGALQSGHQAAALLIGKFQHQKQL